MHLGDIPAGLRLSCLSGWNQLESDWRFFLESPEGGGYVAEQDGEVVGSVTFLRYGQPFTWLSMMLVHPDARRTGLGTRLIETALDALSAEDCIRLDATPLGKPLYRRIGFTAECELARARLTVPPNYLRPSSDAVCGMQPTDFGDVFALESLVFAADRSKLLASFYQLAPSLAWTVRRSDSLAGYCFGRPGRLYGQLGPVVARSMAVARDLVAMCLTGLRGEIVAIDVPKAATEWTEWLESAGFNIERPFLRMHRGHNGSPGIPQFQFAISGPEFG